MTSRLWIYVACALGVTITLAAAPNARAAVGYLGPFTTTGSVPGDVTPPKAVAFGPDGSVYVAERARVLRFTPDGSLISSWGRFGNAPGRFDYISDIDTGPDGSVYVSEWSNHRVQKFTADGSFITSWGGLGHDAGDFYYAAGLATDSVGNVYVSDELNHRIQKFDADGEFLGQWGTEGDEPGQLDRPGEIDTDASGNVYVADTVNHRIQKFAPDGSFITEWGGSAGGPLPPDASFGYISALHVSADGTAYAADGPRATGSPYSRIQRFTSDGALIDEFGCYGGAEANFNTVTSIATDPAGRIFVSDAGSDAFYEGPPGPSSNRVMVFAEGEGTPPPCVAEVSVYEDQYYSNMSFGVACLRADCTVEAGGFIRLGKRRFRIRPVSESLPKKAPRQIEIHVRRRVERRLERALGGHRRKEKRAHAKLSVAITDAEGNSETNTLRFLVAA